MEKHDPSNQLRQQSRKKRQENSEGVIHGLERTVSGIFTYIYIFIYIKDTSFKLIPNNMTLQNLWC